MTVDAFGTPVGIGDLVEMPDDDDVIRTYSVLGVDDDVLLLCRSSVHGAVPAAKVRWAASRTALQRQWYEVRELAPEVRLKLPCGDGALNVIATDASTDHEGMAAWAVVRGDGTALMGWYASERTGATAAELEAMAHGLALAQGERLRLITDSHEAADALLMIRNGGGVDALPRSVLHHGALDHLTARVRSEPIEISVITRPAGVTKYSPEGLGGIADRVAWTALQLALARIDPAHPEVAEWLQSRYVIEGTRRGWLREVFRRKGPGAGHLAGTWTAFAR